MSLFLTKSAPQNYQSKEKNHKKASFLQFDLDKM